VIYGPSGQRICYFVIDSAGQPVDGLAGAVQWRLFRNGAEVFDSVVVTGIGGGLYKAVYTPSSYGQDSLILMVPSIGFYYKDETVEEALYPVSHDYPSADAMRLLEPDPENFQIRIYRAETWSSGLQTRDHCLAECDVAGDGRWRNSFLVPAGYYTVVAVRPGKTIILLNNFQIGRDVDAILLEDTGALLGNQGPMLLEAV